MKSFTLTLLTLCYSLWSSPSVRGACMDDETAVFDNECRTSFRFVNDHNFPNEYSILFDNFDFESLISGDDGQLRTLDVDGVSDDNQGMWTETGGVCQHILRACSTGSPSSTVVQDNWVFTDYIRFPSVEGVSDVEEVFFDANFRFTQCVSPCVNDFATLYRYNVNGPISAAQRITVSNYGLLGGIPDSRLSQGDASRDRDVMWSIPRPNTEGFYLAIRDQGNCGSIDRVIVFYRRSPGYSGTLLTCPSVPFPSPDSGRTTTGTCCCGGNAEPKSSLTRTCSDDETCNEPASDVCGCSPGYQFVGGVCEPCPADTFQPDISTTSMCVSCPNNSMAQLPATPVCECTGGTTRNPLFPRNPCTEPPSAPLLTIEPQVDGDRTTIFWGASVNMGGLDDLHYNVYVYRVGNEPVIYTKVNPNPIVGTGNLTYNVPGLDRSTSYAIVVVAANGATGDPETLDQQLTGVGNHYVAFFVDTGEAGLSRDVGIALTFFITLILVALITAAIVITIMWFACVKKNNATMGTSPKTNPSVNNSDYKEVRNPTYDTAKTESTPPSRPPRPPTKPKY